jgi:hypothetical protein
VSDENRAVFCRSRNAPAKTAGSSDNASTATPRGSFTSRYSTDSMPDSFNASASGFGSVQPV